MNRPRWTRQDLTDGQCAPACPHCRQHVMGEATIKLDELAAHPIVGPILVDAGGYAQAAFGPTVYCPECQRPSVLVITEREMRLTAQRTEADEALLKESV